MSKKKIVWLYCVHKYCLKWVLPVYIYDYKGKTRIKLVEEPELKRKYAGAFHFDKFSNIPDTPKTVFQADRELDYLSDYQYVWLEERNDEWVKDTLIALICNQIDSVIGNIRTLEKNLEQLKHACWDIYRSATSIYNFNINDNS